MKTSEQVNELFTALAIAQGQIKPAIADKVGHFKNKYASLDSIWDACREALSKNGLALSQWPTVDSSQSLVILHQILTHKSGQFIEYDALCIPLEKTTAQGVGIAITYGRRYMIAAAIGVTADEDDDAQSIEQKQPKSSPIPEEDNRPWQQKQPAKGMFFKRAKDDLGLDVIDAADRLKAAGYTNGYDPHAAPDMWQALRESLLAQPIDDIEAEEVAQMLIDGGLEDAQGPDYSE
jgi:hypothetical protein